MPRIDEVVHLVEGASVFTVLDVSSGFWQIGMREQDKEKTAFVTPFGLYQFKVMAQRLINAPATFQRAMQLVLSGLPRELALVYIDDLIVFSKDFDSHLENLRTLLGRVQKCGLKLKVEKAQFALLEVKYLGFLLSADGIRPDPAKLEALRNMEPPRDRAESNRVSRTILLFADRFRKENGILYCIEGDREQLVVPAALRDRVIAPNHDHALFGHLRTRRTLYRVRESFWRPSMANDVKDWCQTCGPCQRRTPARGTDLEVTPIPVSGPRELYGMDIVDTFADLPVTNIPDLVPDWLKFLKKEMEETQERIG
uniref:Reverse transcriptase domain-containing protein n=1 Tax=Chromera velia CCMP2878 TaxID=1169474 RepID=A0A0G4HTJ4_9ALVE|eukprot:Cvel_8496.t1-p1 / transcript=Cvel_8496.t1 / gene=Cvel_8496 / organism=Chromera_velia_CCMP2878 / gene_product=Retrovirus-related Pol polyprotein from transposon, putative / transcript_product=Retrovirus-related Pol polyprotein from transposon, putative / location=Cvel_scaffold469:72033-74268(-) / protein_length=311 / sequence_SO=supercontig / SO=protein_coding / is_pseudo=false